MKSDEHEPGPKLRNAEVARVQHPPIDAIAQGAQARRQPPPVRLEASRREARNVFQEDGLGADLRDQADRRREEIAVVGVAQLLAGHGEGRTGDASREHVGVHGAERVRLADVGFDDGPLGAIAAKRGARVGIVLGEAHGPKPRGLETQGHPAGAGAHFEYRRRRQAARSGQRTLREKFPCTPRRWTAPSAARWKT